MIKNVIFNMINVVHDDAIEGFFYEINHNIRMIVRSVERMIQDYLGILIMPTKITFTTSDLNENFPYYPVIKIIKQEPLNHEEWIIEYECGLIIDYSVFYIPILIISYECYTKQKLFTINEINQYLIWFPSKKFIF